MTAQENPGTVPVRIIWRDSVALLKNTREGCLSIDAKILLASLLFADDEGVTTLQRGQLQRYCATPSRGKATLVFLQRRIDALIEAGVLAPGSTPMELRSMVGRSAYAEVEEAAA